MCAASFSAYRAPRLAICEDKVHGDANNVWDIVRPIVNAGVADVFLIEVNGLKVVPLLTEFTHDLWENHKFLH